MSAGCGTPLLHQRSQTAAQPLPLYLWLLLLVAPLVAMLLLPAAALLLAVLPQLPATQTG